MPLYPLCQGGVLRASHGFAQSGVPSAGPGDRDWPPQVASVHRQWLFAVYAPALEAVQAPYPLWTVHWQVVLYKTNPTPAQRQR